MATAVVSEPPRPSVVMFMVSFENPWKPATIAMLPSRDRVLDAAGRDVDDAGLAVHRRGEHAGLRAGERLGLVAQRVDGHRQQRHRDALAGGEQHVELAPARARARSARRGRSARRWCRPSPRRRRRRRGLALGGDDALGDPLDPLGVGDGRAAVLLHDETHAAVPLDNAAEAPGYRPARGCRARSAASGLRRWRRRRRRGCPDPRAAGRRRSPAAAGSAARCRTCRRSA